MLKALRKVFGQERLDVGKQAGVRNIGRCPGQVRSSQVWVPGDGGHCGSVKVQAPELEQRDVKG